MNKMKYVALLAAFSASICVAQPSGKLVASEPQLLNAVVAVVNNDVITTDELAERAHSAALNLRRQKIQLPPMQQLRVQVLEQLILERAISQRARETGIRVEGRIVKATIEQIAQQNLFFEAKHSILTSLELQFRMPNMCNGRCENL